LVSSWPILFKKSAAIHGSATTTEAIRRAIQHSQESLRALAKRYGFNQKTVPKWKRRTSVADLSTGPRQARSTVLSVEEEAVIVAFRRYTLLPLDDCLDSSVRHPLLDGRHFAFCQDYQISCTLFPMLSDTPIGLAVMPNPCGIL
jgi:hypothetical protein